MPSTSPPSSSTSFQPHDQIRSRMPNPDERRRPLERDTTSSLLINHRLSLRRVSAISTPDIRSTCDTADARANFHNGVGSYERSDTDATRCRRVQGRRIRLWKRSKSTPDIVNRMLTSPSASSPPATTLYRYPGEYSASQPSLETAISTPDIRLATTRVYNRLPSRPVPSVSISSPDVRYLDPSTERGSLSGGASGRVALTSDPCNGGPTTAILDCAVSSNRCWPQTRKRTVKLVHRISTTSSSSCNTGLDDREVVSYNRNTT